MKRIAKYVLFALLVALLACQLVPVERTNPPVETDVPATAEVRSILRRACYDCHSNETVWPWYSRIAPVSWLVERDVRDGRDELNFSIWNQYSTKRRIKKCKEIGEQVAEDEMPPWIYLPTHWDARLSAEDRTALQDWSQSLAGQSASEQ